MYVCARICMCVSMDVCMYVFMSKYMRLYKNIHGSTDNAYVTQRIRMYVCACACFRICVGT